MASLLSKSLNVCEIPKKRRKFGEQLQNSPEPQAGSVAGPSEAQVCRAAYLYHEGGFYLDNDVELVRPVSDLVDPETTSTRGKKWPV